MDRRRKRWRSNGRARRNSIQGWLQSLATSMGQVHARDMKKGASTDAPFFSISKLA
jgi:hypothetical protein